MIDTDELLAGDIHAPAPISQEKLDEMHALMIQQGINQTLQGILPWMAHIEQVLGGSKNPEAIFAAMGENREYMEAQLANFRAIVALGKS